MDTLLVLPDVGEPTYLLNLLCAGLTRWQIPITPAERDALATLLVGVASTNEHYPYLVDAEGPLAGLNVVE